jgi:hypothetical protein
LTDRQYSSIFQLGEIQMVAPDVYKKHQKTNQYTFGLRSTSIYIPSGYDKQFAMERSNMLLKTVDHLFRLGPSINLYHGYVGHKQRVVLLSTANMSPKPPGRLAEKPTSESDLRSSILDVILKASAFAKVKKTRKP